MKITVLDAKKKQPLIATKIQLQVKGRDSGYLTLTTDATGILELDDKYDGQQIAHLLQGQATGQWVTATDGATLLVDTTLTTGGKDKATQTTQSYK